MLRAAAGTVGAQLVLIDVGPNLGAINRSALLAADSILIPLAADLFSLQGLRNLGPTLRSWRTSWHNNVLGKRSVPGLNMPQGSMRPLGYVVLQHAVRLDRPVKAYDRWLRRIPLEFRRSVLGESRDDPIDPDPYRLATLRNYRSLMPSAQDVRKPMFDLRAADGALGSTGRLVRTCYLEFEDLATKVLNRAMPHPELPPSARRGGVDSSR